MAEFRTQNTMMEVARPDKFLAKPQDSAMAGLAEGLTNVGKVVANAAVEQQKQQKALQESSETTATQGILAKAQELYLAGRDNLLQSGEITQEQQFRLESSTQDFIRKQMLKAGIGDKTLYANAMTQASGMFRKKGKSTRTYIGNGIVQIEDEDGITSLEQATHDDTFRYLLTNEAVPENIKVLAAHVVGNSKMIDPNTNEEVVSRDWAINTANKYIVAKDRVQRFKQELQDADDISTAAQGALNPLFDVSFDAEAMGVVSTYNPTTTSQQELEVSLKASYTDAYKRDVDAILKNVYGDKTVPPSVRSSFDAKMRTRIAEKAKSQAEFWVAAKDTDLMVKIRAQEASFEAAKFSPALQQHMESLYGEQLKREITRTLGVDPLTEALTEGKTAVLRKAAYAAKSGLNVDNPAEYLYWKSANVQYANTLVDYLYQTQMSEVGSQQFQSALDNTFTAIAQYIKLQGDPKTQNLIPPEQVYLMTGYALDDSKEITDHLKVQYGDDGAKAVWDRLQKSLQEANRAAQAHMRGVIEPNALEKFKYQRTKYRQAEGTEVVPQEIIKPDKEV